MSNAVVVPNYDFGDTFNYGLWSPNSTITLTNVPWNNDYRDVVRFANAMKLDQWIDAQPNTAFNNSSLIKFDRNSVKVSVPINRAMRYNYLRAHNPLMPVTGDVVRTYYYFILDVVYRAPETTELVLQLDVWQTYGYDVTLGRSYVERGHIGIANTHAFDHYGRDYLTTAEGMDIGGEYRYVHVESEYITADDMNILVCATVDLTQDPGNLSDPGLNAAPGGTFNTLPSGASFYVFEDKPNFEAFMRYMSTRPWITQGIISITIVPIARYVLDFVFDDSHNVSPIPNIKFYLGPVFAPTPVTNKMLPNWRSADFIGNVLGTAYSHLLKFYTYPYMVLELTTWTGSPVIFKPESWQDPDATLKELSAFVPPGQRIGVGPYRYNSDDEQAPSTGKDDNSDFINIAKFIDNFPSLPLVNNMAIGYLAANKNGLQFQQRSADWSQQRALQGAQAQSDIVGEGIGNTARQSAIGVNAASQQAGISAMNQANQMALGAASAGIDMVSNPSSGLMLPGVGARIIGQGMNANAGLDSANVGIAATGASAVSNIQTAGAMRDTNVGLARSVAKGDYANTIAGIQAKIQDAALIQPSTSGQFGGDAFNLVNGLFGYSLRWKMMNLEALRKVGDFWNRYGYSIGRFMQIPANFMVMSKFTYWKMSETYITQAPIPESFKQAIRGIFEKGVTVWADPSYIGTTAPEDNVALTNVSY